MSDKIEIRAGKEFLDKPINNFVELVNENVKKKYPGYKLAWLEGNVSREIIEDEIREIGAKNAKIVELEVDVLPFRHYGVLMPEGQELLTAP